MFQIGRQQTPSIENRPRLLRPRSRKILDTENATIAFEVNFVCPPKWLLLPSHTVHTNIERAFQFIPYGLKNAYTFYLDIGAPPISKIRFRPPKSVSKVNKHPFYCPEFSKELLATIHKNQSIRWRFKRLIHRWRLCRLRQANTIDVVTMETPKTPVYIYDWPNHTKYLFEAQSLFRSIRTSLLLAEELFPTPCAPKNPYTNQPLSYSQLHFTLNTLRGLGMSDWTTESMRASNYELTTFKRRTMMQLRLAALHRIFADPSTEEYVDLIFDFIDFIHDNVEIQMERKDIWEWVIRNAPTNSIVRAWRSLCLRYYRGSISLTEDDFRTLKAKIMAEGEDLLKRPFIELVLLWRNRII